MSGTSIQIYLPNGEPRGLRIAELTTRIVQAIQIPRTKLDEFFARNESQQVGVYYLFGESPEGTLAKAYIGQTEDFKSRLRNHNSNKEFWQTAVAIISKTHSFTQAHIRFMEWLSGLPENYVPAPMRVGEWVIDSIVGRDVAQGRDEVPTRSGGPPNEWRCSAANFAGG